MMTKRYLVVALIAALAAAAPPVFAAAPHHATAERAPLFEGLGAHRMPVTTTVPEAQRYFDQGLALTYGFNHMEAARSFAYAAKLDPECAMAYWGQALALGPNLNMPMTPEHGAQCWKAISRAMELRDMASEKERALIEALAKRFDKDPRAERDPLNTAYVAAMAECYNRWPEDADVATLYAESLMARSPWNYWHPDGHPRPDTPTILAVLEKGIATDPQNPGPHHFYIHAVEASPYPQRALASAEALGALVPGAGHLVHMPSHIFIRVGRYGDAVTCNQKAVAADEGYIDQCRAQGIYPLGYYPHNIHFLWAAAMLDGQSRVALESSEKLTETVPGEMPGHGLSLETFTVAPLFTLVRFGKWDEILALPQPPAEQEFRTAIWHHARGMALTRLGRLDEAQRELDALTAVTQRPRLKELLWLSSPVKVITIASDVLAGEIAAARKDYDAALAHYERAVRLEDSLPYNEPPEWAYPVRHYLGAALLEAGRPTEAEAVYWEDLRRHPNNGYALFGLRESLRAQGTTGEARLPEVEARFKEAWARADITLTASRF